MGKGVLLELAGREAVVLTPQGDFRRVPAPQGTWDIGDEIEFAEARQAPWARWASVAAAAAVMVLAPLGWQSYTLAQPAAIVTMDINPSLQLTLNKKDQVLKAQALNDDGASVLYGVEWKRQPVDTVVAAVTAQAVAQQRLNPADQGAAIVVAVVPVKQAELPKGQADRIRDKAYDAVISVAPETNVAVLEVTVNEKEAAAAVGLNPGKYVLYRTLEEQGVAVEPEEMLQSGPGALLKELGVNPSSIFSQAENKHGGPPAKAKEKDKDKDKDTSTSGTEHTATPVVAPANDRPDDDKKTDDDLKPDDDKKGNGKSDDNDNSGKGNSGSNNGNQSGQSDGNSGKGRTDSDTGSDKQNESDSDQASGKSKKNGASKQSWTVPFIGITIDKPAFLRSQDTEAEDRESPAAGSPRAETPGAGASDKKGNGSDKSDQDREKENGAAGKNGKGKDGT